VLSFVLLFSQQMATAHALEHLTAALDAAQVLAGASDDQASGADASELAKAVAQHQNCHQCLALAQLAGPLASTSFSFAVPELPAHGIARHGPDQVHSSTILASQPRGPPRL
jgi:hypothetical protein